jgi:hypothetical protein
MLTDLLILALVLAAAGVYGAARAARARLLTVGILVLAWRFLSGHTWHGKAVTDAGWLRPGSKAFTPSGHALRWHYRPRWQRAAWRAGGTLAAAVVIMACGQYPAAAPWLVIAITGISLALGGWRGLRWLASRKHRRTWLYPVHLVVAPLLGIPLEYDPRSWLQVEPDRSRVVLELPAGFSGDEKDRARIVAATVAKLGLEAPDVAWKLAGPKPRLELTASAPPPARVVLADVRAAIEAARDDDLVWGIGKRGRVVRNSLSGDSPHWGLSMGSGAGKSVTARALAAQVLYHGGIVLILDYKMISHQWAQGLPNVVIARRPAEIHEALCWLGGDPARNITGELERRNEVALAGADLDGNVHATVGPRLFIVAEEQNATVSRLRKHWNQVRASDDPKRSPALDALDAASFMGRQVKCNILYIGQRLSVKASGGDGDARENIGVIGFGRYSASNWKMLAGDHPMPPKSLTPGRLQVVAGGVTEVQGVLMSGREARALAVAGKVSPLPAGMPGAPRVTAGTPTPIPGPEQGTVTGTGPPPVTAGPRLVTLSEAVAEGIVSCSLAAVRIARHRGRGFPDPAGLRGSAHEYDPLALAEWDAGRQ